MTATNYIIDVLLIALVLRQLRVRRLTTRMVLLPTILVAWAFITYFKAFTLNTNDVVLIVVFSVVGVALGVASGLATRVWTSQHGILCQAGAVAATTWIAGMGFRLAFQIWANTKSGGNWIVRFSLAHHINSEQAWVTALLLMALGEVMARVGILQWRLFTLERKTGGRGVQPVYD
ncbi:MAG: hypothetical protein WAM64_03525 [Acidimicrobiales bacterium]